MSNDTTESKETPKDATKDKATEIEIAKMPIMPPGDDPVVTEHEIPHADGTLRYTVTTGTLPIVGKDGTVEARVFFMAYQKIGADAARPLMFSFNGGPGSSSVWLHLGTIGPKRVSLNDDGSLPPPPYQLVDNPHTWLDKADLVFIDPVGTGYSRAATEELGKKFWSVDGDIASLTEFIRMYLTRYDRWRSPLYLVGESYGTTRGAGITHALLEKGIALSGLLLVSVALSFQTLVFGHGNDLPYQLFLPTYTATAHYHKCLPRPQQRRNLLTLLREVETFAMGEYAAALAKGALLPPRERAKIRAKLAQYTGLSEEYLDRADLRLEIHRFCKELRRDERVTVGRLDSRLHGSDTDANADVYEFDPSMSAITPPYTSCFNDYVRRDLGYKVDIPYYILGGGFAEWNWGNAYKGYVDTSEALEMAFAKNPHLRVFVASGYYDLATPYLATDYTFARLKITPEARQKIAMSYYEAGHMMYIEVNCLEKLKIDVANFLG
jgi:carboxypeptidase C (cathepsin A)